MESWREEWLRGVVEIGGVDEWRKGGVEKWRLKRRSGVVVRSCGGGLRGVVEEWSGNWPLNVYQGWDFALLVFALVAL